jgi:hypothetical protein
MSFPLLSTQQKHELAWQLILRLERLSADSHYAHRASGVKGSLLKCLEQTKPNESQTELLEWLIDTGFEILEKAAAEIPYSR